MELRKDYILDRYVIISEVRGLRPDFVKKELSFDAKADDKTQCFFCPGNEYLTGRERGRLGDPWNIRWFDNKYPVAEPLGKHYIQTDNKFFTFSDAYGYHEVITESNIHEKQLSDFTSAELKQLFGVYKSRTEELSNKDHIRYVLVMKNHGPNAGTSIKHTHSQVLALNHVPKLIRDELSASANYPACPYCELSDIEKGSLRRCFENASFVAFTPYASRFAYEIWIFPKKHYSSIILLNDDELSDLSNIFHKILLKLKELGCSYNFFIHNTPKEFMNSPRTLHFHMEITPRIDVWAGAEIGVETYINKISPETAAKFYRGE